ncbi:MAG: hypothetical protein WA418_14270 [Bradyrhizobium sp.]
MAILAGTLYWQDRMMSAEPEVNHAIRAVKVAIKGGARDHYVGEVEAFAKTFGFTPTFSQTSPDPNDIVAHLDRDDVLIVAVMASKIGGLEPAYKVYFYANRNQSMSPASLDPLVEGLKLHLGGIEGAIVTETK